MRVVGLVAEDEYQHDLRVAHGRVSPGSKRTGKRCTPRSQGAIEDEEEAATLAVAKRGYQQAAIGRAWQSSGNPEKHGRSSLDFVCFASVDALPTMSARRKPLLGEPVMPPIAPKSGIHRARLMPWMLLWLSCGCFPPTPPSPESPKQKLLDSAKAITSDPNNWLGNSRCLTDLCAASVDMGWSDEPEVRDFKAAALDLIAFSTRWVEQLDKAEKKKVTEGFATVTVGLPDPSGEGGMTIDSESRGKQAESVIIAASGKLQEKQAEQFGKLYGRLVEAYENLLKFAASETTYDQGIQFHNEEK